MKALLELEQWVLCVRPVLSGREGKLELGMREVLLMKIFELELWREVKLELEMREIFLIKILEL